MNQTTTLSDLKSLLDALDIGAVLVDEKSNIHWINSALEKVLGYSLSDLENSKFTLIQLSDNHFLHKWGFPLELSFTSLKFEEYAIYLLKDSSVENKLSQEYQKQAILLDAITNAQIDYINKKETEDFSIVFSPLLKSLALITESEFAELYVMSNQAISLLASSDSSKKNGISQIVYQAFASKSPIIQKLDDPLFFNVLAIPLTYYQKNLGVCLFYNQQEGFAQHHALVILPATQSIVQLLDHMEKEKSRSEITTEIFKKGQEALDLTNQLEKQNLQLQLEVRKANEARQSQTIFLTNVSHEIRTPLNGIMGLTELLLNQPLNDKANRYAGLIFQSSETLLALINDLLDLGKIEAGQMTFESILCDLGALIKDVILLLHLKAIDKGVSIQFYYDPNLPAKVFTDPIRIRQIVMNLLSNAIKFTHAGEILIQCHLVRLENEAVDIEFIFSDTGIGIDQDKHEIIFKEFNQIDNTMTKKYGGTGLGLSICKHLVEKIGGGEQIRVSSILGKGTSFSFTLPFKCVISEPLSYPELKGAKVLLIQQNRTAAYILNVYLNFLGMNVESCHQFDEGLSKLQQMQFLQDPFSFVLYGATLFSGKEMERLDHIVNIVDRKQTEVFCCTWENLFDKLIGNSNEYDVKLLAQPITLHQIGDQLAKENSDGRKRRI